MKKDYNKRCAKCENYLPRTKKYFYGYARSSDGLQSWCKECHKAYNKNWVKDNKTHRADYMDKYYEENAETIRETTQEWQEENRAYYNAYARRKYHANKNKQLEMIE